MTKVPLKVRLEDLDANIKHEFFFTAGEACAPKYLLDEYRAMDKDSLDRLTFCVLILQNGFTVTGSNACVHKDTWSAEMGKRMAKEKALDEVWKLMGYELKTAQYLEAQGALDE